MGQPLLDGEVRGLVLRLVSDFPFEPVWDPAVPRDLKGRDVANISPWCVSGALCQELRRIALLSGTSRGVQDPCLPVSRPAVGCSRDSASTKKQARLLRHLATAQPLIKWFAQHAIVRRQGRMYERPEISNPTPRTERDWSPPGPT